MDRDDLFISELRLIMCFDYLAQYALLNKRLLREMVGCDYNYLETTLLLISTPKKQIAKRAKVSF